MKITVNNVDITNRLLEYQISAEMSDDSLLLGNAISKQVNMKLDNQDGYMNNLLDYPFIISNDGSTSTGIFRVYEKPEKYTGELSLTLYDNVYLFSQRYETKLEYPTTIEKQLDEMSTLTGVAINKTTLPLDILSKEVNWYDNTVPMRNYLGWIGELAGCNVFADNKGTIVFRELGKSTYKTIDLETFEKSELVKFTRVCFDDGLLKLETGTDEGNTLYLSSNNGYVDSDTNLESIYNKYKDLTFYSVTNVKMANINGWYLTDLINYNDEFAFMPLSISESYQGGQYSIASVEGNINTQNNEMVVNKVDPSVKIKRLQVIVDKNNQELEVLNKDLENGLGQISNFKVSLEKISQKVSSTEETVKEFENNLNIQLSANLPLNQVYETSTNLFFPDYEKQNLVVTAACTLLNNVDATKACNFVWKRKTAKGETNLVAGETANKNILTVNKNVLSSDKTIDYVCYVTFNAYKSKANISISLSVNGKDGINGTPGLPGENGKQQYIHIRYSNDGGKTFTVNNGIVAGDWMGTYVDFNKQASGNVKDYDWVRVKGEPGEDATIKSNTAPSDTTKLWCDTSVTPNVIKSYNDKTKQWEIVNDVTTFNRNWAIGTSVPFVKDDGYEKLKDNKTPFNRVYIPYGAKAGDKVTIAFDFEATDIVSAPGTTGTWMIEGEGNINGWGLSRYPHNGNLPINQSGHWSYTTELTAEAAENEYWNMTVRCDNITSGHIKVFNYIFVKGSKEPDWAPAPEDLITQIGGRNLIIRSKEIKDFMIQQGGTLEEHVNHNCVEFIEIEPNTVYSFSKVDTKLPNTDNYFRYSWYDKDKVYISDRTVSQDNEYQRTSPVNAKYISLSYPDDSMPKFERGTKATDWSPAPEDVDYSIYNGLDNLQQTVTTQYDSEINNLKSEISTLVSKITNVENDYSSISEEVASQIKQEADNIALITTNIKTINDNLTGLVTTEEIKHWAEFSDKGVLSLGTNRNEFSVQLSNKELGFYEGSNKVAFISNKELFIDMTRIINQLAIGKNGEFTIKVDSNLGLIIS